MPPAKRKENLKDLVPDAMKILEAALKGDAVPPGRAKIALDIVKAADVKKASEATQGSDLAKRLAELDAASVGTKSD